MKNQGGSSIGKVECARRGGISLDLDWCRECAWYRLDTTDQVACTYGNSGVLPTAFSALGTVLSVVNAVARPGRGAR
jgi:hypothetical protein